MKQTFQRQFDGREDSSLAETIREQVAQEARDYFNKEVELVNLHEVTDETSGITLLTAIYKPKEETI